MWGGGREVLDGGGGCGWAAGGAERLSDALGAGTTCDGLFDGDQSRREALLRAARLG